MARDDSPDSPPPFPGLATELLPPQIGRLGPRDLLVNELFHSIQGESSFAGWPCFFIRLAGCHLRCSWCDTEYAFHEGRVETVDECLARAAASGCKLVELTGGEPLLQKAALPLLSKLCDRGHEVLLETSGTVPLHRVDPRVRKIVDVKAPGSGMARHNLRGLTAQLSPRDELKLVLAGREDYEWARAWLAEQGEGLRRRGVIVHLSPVTGALPPANLAAWMLEDGLEARLNLQLHRLIWPQESRGR
jgi:7-carboxy-7-deazaguanine synthase